MRDSELSKGKSRAANRAQATRYSDDAREHLWNPSGLPSSLPARSASGKRHNGNREGLASGIADGGQHPTASWQVFRILPLALFLGVSVAHAAQLVVDGTTETIDSNAAYDGILVRGGGDLTITRGVTGDVTVTCSGDIEVEDSGSRLTLDNATIHMNLDFDEQYSVQVWDESTLAIENGGVLQTINDRLFWIQLSGPDDPGSSFPTMTVAGTDSLLTNHSGIRPYNGSTVIVSGGDVEELQVRDQVQVSVTGAATYPVFFFEGPDIDVSLGPLDVGTGITYEDPISDGTWSFSFTNATVDGYQIDLKKGATVDLTGGDGIVVSLHTPGTLGDELRIVDSQTSDDPTSGSITNLGTSFTFTDSNIALINVYVFGRDRVLLSRMHVNEVNAEETSELIIGRKGFDGTVLNCNLCYLYDSATMTVVNADIDDTGDNIPSATATDIDLGSVADGVMTFSDAIVDALNVTVINDGIVNLFNSTTPNDIVVVGDATAPIEDDYAALFTATRLTGAPPLSVDFIDMSAGENISSYSWTFGDGAGSSAQHPSHTYTEPGTYDVELTITFPSGGQRTSNRSAYILLGLFFDGFESGDTTAW